MSDIVTTSYGSDEIRAFGDPDDFCAIPVTLDSAVGSLPVGTALGRITASGKYKAYLDGEVDGSGVCSGILAQDFTRNYPSLTGENLVTSMYISGNFIESKLAAAGLDAAGIADLKARSIPGRDVLIIPGC
jgi:hypothetical protein